MKSGKSFRLYRTESGPVLEDNGAFRLLSSEQWDSLINRDDLYEFLSKFGSVEGAGADTQIKGRVLAPLDSQEVWACGVTYYSSRLARMEEAKDAGGGDFYARVYQADRPEIFFKASSARVSAPEGEVRIRGDSTWNVPEPELTLFVTTSGKIVAYTIGNDMSSRSIEGENPLYLPQAKTYEGCAALGPCLLVPSEPLPSETAIGLLIERNGAEVFRGETRLEEMKRKPEELVHFLFRELAFPHGVLLMTGTGVVPDPGFTLEEGDRISITIEPIGTLTNTVAQKGSR